MATRTLRLKVAVADLITRIEDRQAVLQAEHEKAVAEYPKLLAIWNRRAIHHLREAITTIEETDDAEVAFKDSRYRNGKYVTTICVSAPRLADRPSKPSKPNTDKVNRDLRLLKSTSEEFITVSADDNLASYL